MSSLRTRVTGAAGWSAGSYAVSQILRLTSNVILARALFEEAFALMAIVTAIIQGLAMFTDIGLGPNVVQNKRGDSQDFLGTIYTIQVVRGALLAVATAALAWPLADFYSTSDPLGEELKGLLPLAAVATFISGFNSTRVLAASRDLQLGRVTLIDLSSQVIGLSAVVYIATATKSLYAFPIGSIIAAIVFCSLSHLWLQGPRDRFAWDGRAARDILRFGQWLFLSTIASYLALQVDRLALPKLFSLEEAGVYSIAISLALVVPAIVGNMQLAVAFPLYSELLRRDPAKGLEVFSRVKRAMVLAASALCATLAACAAPFLDLAYDERYASAKIYVPILAIAAYFACVEQVYGAAFLALGRSALVAMANATKVITYAVLLAIIGTGYGVVGACVAYVGGEFAKALAAAGNRRAIGSESLVPEVVSLGVGIAVAGSLLYLDRTFLQPSGLADWARLLLCATLGSLAFAVPIVRILKPVLAASGRHAGR